MVNAQSLATGTDTPLPVLLTGSDVEGDPITYSVVDPPKYGTLSGSPPHLTYTPAPNTNLADSFT